MSDDTCRAKYVYLDTSHQSLLARRMAGDSAWFSKFVERWRAQSCALIVTRCHLLEIRKHADPAVRQSRYSLFEVLLPVVSDSPHELIEPIGPQLLIEREALIALVRRGDVGGSGPGWEETLSRWCTILPGVFDTCELVRQLTFMEGHGFDLVTAIVSAAMQTGAQARSRPHGTPYERSRVRDLPDAVPSSDFVQQAVEQFQAASDEVKMSDILRPLLGDEAVASLYASAERMVREALERGNKLGPQKALLEHLEEKLETASGRFTDELVQEFVFKSTVRHALSEHVQFGDEVDLENVMRSLRVVECPGTWLKNAVEVQLRKGTAEAASSDEFDLDHIAFLPYVDVMTVDKRIAEFTRQVLSRRNLPESLVGARAPVSAANLDELTQAIFGEEGLA